MQIVSLRLGDEPAASYAPPGRLRAQITSLLLHVGAFFALMGAPPISLPSLPPPSPSEYQQAFAGKEDKLVWYRFKELPDISPEKSSPADRPLRAAVKASQSIVASAENAPQRPQIVLAPVPAAVDLPQPDVANLLAVKLPPKPFLTPPDIVKPVPQIQQPESLTPEQRQLAQVSLPEARLPGKPYIAPAQKPAEMPKIAAPEYEAQSQTSLKLPAEVLPTPRLPGKPYVAPAQQKSAVPTIAAPSDLAAAASLGAPASASLPSAKLPARAYVVPAAPPSAPGATVQAPSPDGQPSDISIAIASLNPSSLHVDLPTASSPAQFSAGSEVHPDGAASDGTQKGVTVPSLFARAPSSDSGPKPDLLARDTGAQSRADMLRDSQRYAPPPSARIPPPQAAPEPVAAPASSALTPSAATRVSSAPDSRFNGRDVYLMAIQMPNLTSYSGSWLMWYSDRTARETGQHPIAAPVPHRKVDPKYLPALVEERIQGRVQLYCVIGRDGFVKSVELLRGVDPRLDRSAEEALSKWEFYPAMRDGQPVDVDVVVEIPFVLAPRTATR